MGTQPEKQHKKLNILVVEDNTIGIRPIGWCLERLGHNVKKVYDCREALSHCRNNPDVNLVIMDIIMPEMDGFELTLEIRKFNKELVIIAVAPGPGGVLSRKEVMEHGCNDFIEKPVNIELLTSVIQKYQPL